MCFTDTQVADTASQFDRADFYPPDASCSCYTCQNFTRAYLNHLFKIGDILSATLATIHNLAWFAQFMGEMRQSILEQRFEAFRKHVHTIYPEKKEVQAWDKLCGERPIASQSVMRRERT